jgi:phosphatidylserine decarboxylase
MITEVSEPSFIKGKAIRLSIFMNVFNVHVNRYPMDGTVKYLFYNKGKFLNAASDKSSLENEQMSVGLNTPYGPILVRQIAGLIARRIVTYSKMDEVIHQADRMGMIRFGSRVDVFLPMTARVRAKPGDITTAGVTVLADFQ